MHLCKVVCITSGRKGWLRKTKWWGSVMVPEHDCRGIASVLGRWSRYPNMSRKLQAHNWKCDPSEEAELDAEALPWQVTGLNFLLVHLYTCSPAAEVVGYVSMSAWNENLRL
jgi:hypothetical protein